MLLQALAAPGPELIEGPAGLGHADHRHVEVAALDHRLQRREDLLVGEIARGAEEDAGVGVTSHHGLLMRSPRRLLDVPAELEAHRREHLVLEVRLAPRAESRVERRREHRRGHGLVDAAMIVQRPSPESDTRPANFDRPGSSTQCGGGQVQQPGGDHAAPPPHLGDVAEVEVVLVVLGVAQGRGLGVDLVRALPMLAALRTPSPSA